MQTVRWFLLVTSTRSLTQARTMPAQEDTTRRLASLNASLVLQAQLLPEAVLSALPVLQATTRVIQEAAIAILVLLGITRLRTRPNASLALQDTPAKDPRVCALHAQLALFHSLDGEAVAVATPAHTLLSRASVLVFHVLLEHSLLRTG